MNKTRHAILEGIRKIEMIRPGRIAWTIFVLAFFLRFTARIIKGEHEFWTVGYVYCLEIARNLGQSSTFAFTSIYGTKLAFWPPLFPLILALFPQDNVWYWPLIALLSAIGASTAVIVYYIGRELFDRGSAILAALYTAVYPYFVVHDVTIQDTALFTFLTTLSIFLLIKGSKNPSKLLWAASGITIGLAVLTRATLQPFVILLLIWLVIVNRRRFAIIGLAVFLTISPWLIRNYIQMGSPVISSQTGRLLWIAHSDLTLAYYPAGSIDLSDAEAYDRLSQEELNTILGMDEITQSDYFKAKGIEYIKQNPGTVIYNSWVKVITGFSWIFSPRDGTLKQVVYFLSYFPILILGVFGAFYTRKRWREFVPIYLLFINFIAGTAIFWAHTSHRSFLDVYFILFAAHVVFAVAIPRIRAFNAAPE